jgi:hypothetical protein
MNDDRMSSRYQGIAFEIKKRMANRWQANVGYTFSKSTGRLGSSSARNTPVGSQTSTAGVFGQNPNDYINSDGRLHSDRPHVLKAQFIYQLPWAMMTSFSFQSQSGKPIIIDARPSSSLTSIPGTNNVVAQRVDGDLRVSSWTTLDARLEKAFRLGGTAELAAFGDFLNLFNNDAYESVLDRRPTSSTYLVPSRFIAPRRLMIGGKFRF